MDSNDHLTSEENMIKIRQSQVQNIINLIQEKFDLTEEEILADDDSKLKLENENSDLSNNNVSENMTSKEDPNANDESNVSQKSSRDTGFYELSNQEQSSTTVTTVTSSNTNTNSDCLSSTSSAMNQDDYSENSPQYNNDEQIDKDSDSPNLDEKYYVNTKESIVENNNYPFEDEREDDLTIENDEKYFVSESLNTAGQNDINTLEKLIDFIDRAIEFEANAIDLSRKGLKKLPNKIFELNNLQYIYLEGNHLTELPKRFFEKFPKLKWLDIRNNFIEELPTAGLERHEYLRYLLLENNKIKKLPKELANLRNLTALNLIDNPIEYPPMEIIQKGSKAVQEYLKNEIKRNKNFLTSDDDYDNYSSIRMFNDDVWASEEENEPNDNIEKYTTLSASYNNKNKLNRRNSNSIETNSYLNYKETGDARIKSATKNILVSRQLRPSENDTQNVELKERLQKAKVNANRISKSAVRLLEKRKSLPPVPSDDVLLKNKEYEKAVQTGKVENYKKSKERIDAKLQKVNDKVVSDEFKNELRSQQRKLFNKKLVKGVDYVEPVVNAPFDISDEHLMVMTNEERQILDRKLANERMRPISPDTLWRIEEERRLRDNELQDKIREYTQKLLINRSNKNLNPKLDRIQAARDLRELKKLEKELNQRRSELQHNYKATTGSKLVYRETAKLNSKATLNIKKNSSYDY